MMVHLFLTCRDSTASRHGVNKLCYFETSGFGGYVHLGISARCGGVYRRCNSFAVQSNERPLGSAQHDDGYSAASQVLLMTNAFIGGKKHVEAGSFRLGQQVAVAERIPSSVFGPCD